MKWVFAVAALPAPLTPLCESHTMPRVEVDDACLHKRCKRKDDRGGIAARVGDQPRRPDRLAVQLGAAIHGLRLERVRPLQESRIGPACTRPRCPARAERHAPERSITRRPRASASGTHSRDCSCGVARNRTLGAAVCAAVCQVKRHNLRRRSGRRCGPAADAGRRAAAAGVSRISMRPRNNWRTSFRQPRVGQQQPRQLRARVAGHAGHGCAHGRCAAPRPASLVSPRPAAARPSQPINPSMRTFSSPARTASSQMTSTVSSPAMVPMSSGQSS